MKGFLIKDLYLLFQRRQMLFLLLACCLTLGLTMDPAFVIGYMAFISVILANGTLSYDDADNGMMFLMTLPAERRTYAYSKYVLGGLMAGCAWALSTLVLLAANGIRGGGEAPADIFLQGLACLPAALAVMDFMIPMQLKFGAEKSRLVLALAAGAIAVISMMIAKLSGGELPAALAALESVTPVQAGIAGAVVCVLGTLVSLRISRAIVEKKTF